MSSLREDLLNVIADAIRHLDRTGIRRIAVDGVDGAGKTPFADELAALGILR
jgi:uridine kinase